MKSCDICFASFPSADYESSTATETFPARDRSSPSVNSCCPVCAQPLPPGTRTGFCPACSLRGALEIHEETDLPADRERVLGGHELLEVIGRGGMGIVWRARQLSLNRLVALKLIVAGEFASPEARRRFREEALAAAQLRHPNIVGIHEIGEEDGQAFFSMELIEGRTLADVTRSGPIPAREAAALLLPVIEAVQFAHEKGVLHRDLKPSNLLLDAEGVARVTDFGLSRRLDATDRQTLTGDVLGSPAYLAPEQARGERAAESVRTDVYALGAILYELLTGRPPFLGESPVAVLQQVLHAEPVALRTLNPAVPIDLQSVCLKCLEKEPARRYVSATELAEEMQRFRRGEAVAVRPVGWWGRAWRWSRRHPAKAGFVVAMALLLATLSIVPSVAYFKVRRAEQAREAQLRETLLTQAWATRRSGQPGQRVQSLKALREAVALGGDEAFRSRLRREAIASLALPDVWVEPAPELPAEFDPTMMRVSPDQRFVAHGLFRGPLRLLRAADGSEVARIEIKPRTLQHVLEFSPDGRFIAARHGNEIVVWDWTNRVAVVAQPAWLNRFSFRPDSRIFAVARSDGTVAGFQLPSGEPAWTWSERSDAKTQVLAFEPSGKVLAWATGGARGIELRDALTGRLRRALPSSVPFTTLSWSVAGRSLAAGDENGRIYVWEFDEDWNVIERQQLDLHSGFVRTLGWSADGRWLASAGFDEAVRLTEVRAGRVGLGIPAATFQLQFSGDGSRVGPVWQQRAPRWLALTNSDTLVARRVDTKSGLGFAIALDAAGRRLAVTRPEGIAWWETMALTESDRFKWEQPTFVRFTADGGMVTTTLGELWRWPVGQRTPVKIAAAGGEYVVLTPDERWFAMPDFRGEVARLFRDGTNALTLSEPRVTGVTVSPDGRHAVTTSLDRGQTRLWETATGRVIDTWPDEGNNRVEFSPDGRWLAQFGLRVRFRDATTWKPGPPLPELPSNSQSCPAAFSPDGRFFALTAANAEVHVLAAPDWRLIATLESPRGGRINRLAWSGDGARLAVATMQGEVQLWRLTELKARLRELRLVWE